MALLNASSDIEAAADLVRNSVDTNGLTATAGKLLSVRNNKTEKFAVKYNGAPQLTVGTLAPAGTVQADAAAITDPVTTSTGDGTAGIKLPTCAAGLVYFVYNLHATAALLIYPNTSDDINDGTVNTSISIEGKSLAMFVGVDATTWSARYTVNV